MITIDVPRNWLLTSNQRLHWAAKADRTRLLKGVAATKAVAFRRELTQATPLPYRVRCVVEVQWPDGRRRDAHNLAPTAKACIDAMVASRLIFDDSDAHFVGPDFRVVPDRCGKDLACSLRFLLYRESVYRRESNPYRPEP